MSRVIRSAGVLALAWCVFGAIAARGVALPAGRAYEMVSPPYKGGYGVFETQGVALNGAGVVFLSQGAFDGTLDNNVANDYLVRRGSSGWLTTALEPPASLVAPLGPIRHDMTFSPTLEYALVNGVVAPSAGSALDRSAKGEFLLRSIAPGTAPDWSPIGPNEGILETVTGKQVEHLQQLVGSAGFCHVLFYPAANAYLLEEAVGAGFQVYDLSRGCGAEAPTLRLIGVKNEDGPSGEPGMIDRSCSMNIGSFPGELASGKTSAFNAIATDGAAVFFMVNVEAGSSPSCGTGDAQVFVRLGGERTVEVSKPLGEVCEKAGEVPCEPGAAVRARAIFAGASEDGSRVLFKARAPLTSEDKDSSDDLYMASIGCPVARPACAAAEREVTALTRISHSPTAGEAAEVQDAVTMSSDLSHVYYVARGVLSEGANAEGHQPVRGAQNLYLYEFDASHPEGHTSFLAELCSGPGLSGEVADPSCPASLQPESSSIGNDTHLWKGTVGTSAQATPDGRFLAFSTYARLIARGPEADTDNARDVYRYDAQTGGVERISVGEDGYGANGNHEDGIGLEDAEATIREASTGNGRAVSDDGSRIAFDTMESLSPGAVNGLSDIYEWHEGSVSLISSGNSPLPDCCASLDPSGNDVFFTTSDGLLPQDIDGVKDIYDARVGGGFAPAGASRQPCAGDACQGPLTNPAPLLVPGSVSQAPGENIVPVKKATKKRATKRRRIKKKKRKAKRARHARVRGRAANGGGGGQ